MSEAPLYLVRWAEDVDAEVCPPEAWHKMGSISHCRKYLVRWAVSRKVGSVRWAVPHKAGGTS
jgi:hypothetical protein